LGWFRWVHVEVNFSCEPLVTHFAEECGGEAEERAFVWEEGSDAGAAFEFLIDAFDGVASAHAAAVGIRESKDGEALGDIFFHPSSEFWGGFGVVGDAFLETSVGAGQIWAGKNGTDVGGDDGAHVDARNVGLSVLLEMELAALPRDRGEDGLASDGHARMGVADDELDAVQATDD